jgi:HK97 family phage major capsid protein
MLELKNAAGDGPADTSVIPAEIRATLDKVMSGVKTLKDAVEANDREVKKVGGEIKDVVRKDQIDRINAGIEELKADFAKELTALKRRAVNGEKETPAELVQYKSAFDAWFRKGGQQNESALLDASRKAFEAKAMSVQSDADGGYMVFPETERTIEQTVRDISPMRQAAQIVQIGTDRYRKPMNVHGTNSGWVGETGARTETATSTLQMGEFPVFEIYANAAATQQSLDDAQFNIEQFIADEVALEFAVQEGSAFINGDGVLRPRGLLTYTTAADAGAGVTWGSIGRINTGASGAFKTRSGDVNPADDLITLQYRLKPPYRANAVYMMNKLVLGSVRIMKDGQGNFIGGHRLTDQGIVDIVYGRPVVEAEDMPNLGASSLSVAFGDFARAYLIVDRIGIRVLRDPFTSKPNVLFYTTKRVGGGVQNFEAVKLLQFV